MGSVVSVDDVNEDLCVIAQHVDPLALLFLLCTLHTMYNVTHAHLGTPHQQCNTIFSYVVHAQAN